MVAEVAAVDEVVERADAGALVAVECYGAYAIDAD